MNISSETVITCITTLIGLGTMIFGLSSETTTALQEAVAPVVGGVMAVISVVSYLNGRRKARETVFYTMTNARLTAEHQAHENGESARDAANESDKQVLALAREIGLI